MSRFKLLMLFLIAVSNANALQNERKFIGLYALEKSIKGNCPEGLEVLELKQAKSNPNKNKSSLTFVELPKSSNKVVAYVLDIDAGEIKEAHVSLMTGFESSHLRHAYTNDYPSRLDLLSLQGEPANFFPNLKKGTFFHANLIKNINRLEISKGSFTTEFLRSYLILKSDMLCYYQRK